MEIHWHRLYYFGGYYSWESWSHYFARNQRSSSPFPHVSYLQVALIACESEMLNFSAKFLKLYWKDHIPSRKRNGQKVDSDLHSKRQFKKMGSVCKQLVQSDCGALHSCKEHRAAGWLAPEEWQIHSSSWVGIQGAHKRCLAKKWFRNPLTEPHLAHLQISWAIFWSSWPLLHSLHGGTNPIASNPLLLNKSRQCTPGLHSGILQRVCPMHEAEMHFATWMGKGHSQCLNCTWELSGGSGIMSFLSYKCGFWLWVNC